MSNDVLISKIEMECPLCGEKHFVEKRLRKSKANIKNQIVEFPETYYVCTNADVEENEFVPSNILDQNLLNARNAYRIKNGLLTSYEIVKIRGKYELSQIEMAQLLGWGEATISRYESKQIQDDTYDKILRLIDESPMEVLKFLEKNANKFSNEKIIQIRKNVITNLDDYGKEYLKRQELESEYVKYQDKNDFNGYCNLNIDKIESMISYFAINVNYLYKVKLMKLLWYADALYYKKYGCALTGLVYRHMRMGALPIAHHQILELEKVNCQEDYDEYYNLIYKIMPCDCIKLSSLTSDELDVLSAVSSKFKEFKANDIVEYMHQESAYIKTAPEQIIPFSLAKEIRNF